MSRGQGHEKVSATGQVAETFFSFRRSSMSTQTRLRRLARIEPLAAAAMTAMPAMGRTAPAPVRGRLLGRADEDFVELLELEDEDGAVVLLLCSGAATEEEESSEDSVELCELELSEDVLEGSDDVAESEEVEDVELSDWFEDSVDDADSDVVFVDSDEVLETSEDELDDSFETFVDSDDVDEDSVDSDEVLTEEDCEESCEVSLEALVDSDEDVELSGWFELSDWQVRWHDWSAADSDGAAEGAAEESPRSQGRETSETVTFSSASRTVTLSSLTCVLDPSLAQ